MIVTPIIRPISNRDRVIDRAIITVIITPEAELLCLSSPTADDDVIALPTAPDVYITMYNIESVVLSSGGRSEICKLYVHHGRNSRGRHMEFAVQQMTYSTSTRFQRL